MLNPDPKRRLTAQEVLDHPWLQNITEFQTNLVPYPHIHFMLSSYAPVNKMEATTPKYSKAGYDELVKDPQLGFVASDSRNNSAKGTMVEVGKVHFAETTRFALGVTKLILVVHTMDEPTVKWSKDRYDETESETIPLLKSSGYYVKKIVQSLPIFGLVGSHMETRMDMDGWVEKLIPTPTAQQRQQENPGWKCTNSFCLFVFDPGGTLPLPKGLLLVSHTVHELEAVRAVFDPGGKITSRYDGPSPSKPVTDSDELESADSRASGTCWLKGHSMLFIPAEKGSARHLTFPVSAARPLLKGAEIQGKRGLWFSGLYHDMGYPDKTLRAELSVAHAVLGRSFAMQPNLKHMDPSCAEAVTRHDVERFLKQLISTRCLPLLDEESDALTFEDSNRRCNGKIAVMVCSSNFDGRSLQTLTWDTQITDVFINGEGDFGMEAKFLSSIHQLEDKLLKGGHLIQLCK